MKKFLLSIVVLAIVITLGGCFGGSKKASKVTFTVENKSEASVLELTPDYEKRTIAATYNSGALKEDISSTGQIGGEYFDRFEKIVDFVIKYEKSLDVAWPVIPTDPASYSVNVEFKDGKSYKVDWLLYDDSVEEFAEFESFYSDVTILLTESEQI
ncbi:MAG: hypothetical protein AAB953_03375 [Patescibacteria group bacterium]